MCKNTEIRAITMDQKGFTIISVATHAWWESDVCQTWKIMQEARALAKAHETNATVCPLFRFMPREAMEEEIQTIDNNSRRKNGTAFLMP